MKPRPPTIPRAPRSIQKGTPLKTLLNAEAVTCLAQNILYVHNDFEAKAFCDYVLRDLEPLELMQRGLHIARALHHFLPGGYANAIALITASFAPVPVQSDATGLASFFYLPHSFFISEFGLDKKYNKGKDPFACSMMAMHDLTTRFTSEFAIRSFLINEQKRTLAQIKAWINDPDPHVRRLCSEGTRPRLPWGKRITSFIANPRHTLPILERLKDDPSLYVRRSVANHLGDIAKDHPEIAFSTCERWLQTGASKDRKWLIRHAMRYPAKKGDAKALEIRAAAKGR